MPCWLVWWWRDTTSLPASTHPQLTASSLASSRTLEAAPVLSPRRWLFRGTPTQHKQLSGAWRYNPAAVQWKHFENKQNSSYLRNIYQRSRYIYANNSSQWWTSRSGRRATAPSSSTAWRASRSRRRTTRTTTSDTISVSGLYHHRIMTDNVMNPPTRIYRTSHSGFNTSIFDRILIWKPIWCKSVNWIFNFCTRIQNRNRGDVQLYNHHF